VFGPGGGQAVMPAVDVLRRGSHGQR
jgi:hypothetical protein